MIDTYSIKKDFSIVNAKWLLDTISGDNPTNYLYTYIGRVTPWAIETEPDMPVDDVYDYINDWKGMLALKRVQPVDMTLAIRKIVWTSGTVYAMYDDRDPNLYNSNYYVFTSNNKIYKCLDNNNGAPSTVEPNSTSYEPYTEADNYKWQLMYDIAINDLSKWSDDTVLPVTELTSNNNSTQWNVQTNAIPGTIDHIKVVDGGSNYLIEPIINIAGDGVGAEAEAVLNNNAIEKIIITKRGEGYTYATATVNGNAILQPIISPVKGHGSNAVEELNGRYLMIRSTFDKDEGGSFPVDVSFRQIGLVLNPTLFGTSEVADDTAGVNQMAIITFAGDPSTFIPGEQILNQTNNSTAIFVSYEGNDVKVTNINGRFNIGDSIIGVSSGKTTNVNGFTPPYLNLYSGTLLYTENREPVTRLATQTETYKLVIAF